jgi:hypothetical protein
MPGAEVIAGTSRQFFPPPLPVPLPAVSAKVDADSIVTLSWERSARTIGLAAEVHRGEGAEFVPVPETRLEVTELCVYEDRGAPEGDQHYAVVLRSGAERSAPIRAHVPVPPPRAPRAPASVTAESAPGSVALSWDDGDAIHLRYHVYRRQVGTEETVCLTTTPIAAPFYVDVTGTEGVEYAYTLRAVSRRDVPSAPSDSVTAAARPEIKDPLFAADFTAAPTAALHGGGAAAGTLHGKARVSQEGLDLRAGGHATFAHRPEFDLTGRISVACRVRFTRENTMPVVVSCGQWKQAGWFLQRIGRGWRWHVGGIDCDGGRPSPGAWTHLVATYDGRTARLFQDGRLVAETRGAAVTAPWAGPLHVGQYSGGPAPVYQVEGFITGLRIYGRALAAGDGGVPEAATR